MPGPLLIDLSHTSHSAARSGIQRVTRGLWRALGADGVPITFDPWQRDWRPLEPWERSALEAPPPAGGRRGAHWPLSARLRGWLRRRRAGLAGAAEARGAKDPRTVRREAWGESGGLIVPEIFSARIGSALPGLLAGVRGPRIALFHDAAALRYPDLSPARTVARFPGYLAELAQFDGVAAVSASARRELLDYWKWAGIENPPCVEAIPLGVEPPSARHLSEGPPGPLRRNGPVGFPGPDGLSSAPSGASAAGAASPEAAAPLEILFVGSIEGRKNHLALLAACETLWSEGLAFRLRLIGHAQAETGAAALRRIRELIAAGRPLVYQGIADDEALEAAYAAAAFTVYPSVAEGYGLPVAESLLRGKPCIGSLRGAVGEIANLGGCLGADPLDAASLANACRRLLADPQERGRLAAAAAALAARGALPTPADHARSLVAWMETLA